LSTASIAVPEAFRYIFGAIATTGDRRKEAVMDWARILAYVTGTVDQELLARNEYAWAMAVGVDLGFVAFELSQLAINDKVRKPACRLSAKCHILL
jgi:hypothetical protein